MPGATATWDGAIGLWFLPMLALLAWSSHGKPALAPAKKPPGGGFLIHLNPADLSVGRQPVQKVWRMPKAKLLESVPAEAVTPPRNPPPPGASWPAPLLLKRVSTAFRLVRLDSA